MNQLHPRIAERAVEPRYTIPEAAEFIERPTSTVRRWALGNVRRTHKGHRHVDDPLILIDGAVCDSIVLSFLNLLELRFLAAYRRNVPLQSIRRALEFAGSVLEVDRPLLSLEFKRQADEGTNHRIRPRRLHRVGDARRADLTLAADPRAA